MRYLVSAALLAGTIATPAFAQESSPHAGFRVEGIVGYDRADVAGDGTDGVLYGVGVGYDFQAGNAIFGIEGEASDSTVDECVADATIPGDELCGTFGRDLYVGGRVGAVVGGNTLLYAKAGYTNARIGLDYEDGTAATDPDFSVGTNLDGVRAGAGAQFDIGENTYLKTEYRYSNYEQGFDRHQVVAGFGLRF